MRIYRVRADTRRYRSLALEDGVGAAALRFDGRPIEGWRPPRIRVVNAQLPAPDFWGIADHPAAYAMTARAVRLAGAPWINQLLPITIEGAAGHLVNVTVCINVLDRRRAIWAEQPDGTRQLVRYVFHPDRVTENRLFKIPETAAQEVLCWHLHDEPAHALRSGAAAEAGAPFDPLVEPSHEFRTKVHAQGLTGLIFELLWAWE